MVADASLERKKNNFICSPFLAAVELGRSSFCWFWFWFSNRTDTTIAVFAFTKILTPPLHATAAAAAAAEGKMHNL